MEASHATTTHATTVHSLSHHFGDMEQQRQSSALGMWVFLITEIMFFGGMFAAYMIYRVAYSHAFFVSSEHMNFWAGTINTVVLLCSSLTMVLAIRAVQVNNPRLSVLLLGVTLLFGLAFLGIKAFEYHEHWVHHLFPGAGFRFEGADPRGAYMFFSLYFTMTGFHALHMIIGIGLVSTIAFFTWRGKYTPEYHNPMENVGLYWHFVDIVWIFLYPLLYLISHHNVGG